MRNFQQDNIHFKAVALADYPAVEFLVFEFSGLEVKCKI